MSNFNKTLKEKTLKQKSFLIVGLDPDLKKMPVKDIFEFNKEIIDKTYDIVVGYKPQLAFYEAQGIEGMKMLAKTIEYIKNLPEKKLIIGDCKRSDIDSTSEAYAKAMFEYWDFDACTIVPYFGKDGIIPFSNYVNKGVFIVCKSSNNSGKEIQDFFSEKEDLSVYQKVAKIASNLNTNHNIGLVMGATYPNQLSIIRKEHPDLPFLIPGIGHQKGDLEKVINYSTGENTSAVLINSSRGIIYASNDKEKYGISAREKALETNKKISDIYN